MIFNPTTCSLARYNRLTEAITAMGQAITKISELDLVDIVNRIISEDGHYGVFTHPPASLPPHEQTTRQDPGSITKIPLKKFKENGKDITSNKAKNH